MRYLVRERKQREKAGFRSISVDAKQRKLIGNFKNPGRTYRRKAWNVLESDYPSDAEAWLFRMVFTIRCTIKVL
jgi:hypothetical protein